MTSRATRPARKASTLEARRAWSRHTEAASFRMREPLLDKARRDYETLVDPAQKLRLAREIAQTRGAELTLAYRNVVMVASGFKRVGSDEGETLTRTPCVVFVVRRKWKRDQHSPDDIQYLPLCLLTHATVDGQRVLVAVPTDVQLETLYSAARAHAERGICVRFEDVGDEYGTLASVVSVRGAGDLDGLYGLAPLHVLTRWRTDAENDLPIGDVPVEQADHLPQEAGAPRLGNSLALGGQLVPGPDISFDAQLMRVSNMDEVAHMLADMPLSIEEPFVASPDRYDELVSGPTPVIELLVPANNPLVDGTRPRLFATAAGTSTHAHPVPYSTAAGETAMVHHWELVQLRCANGQQTLPGDSGTPAVIWRDDGTCTLIGMHIAGDGQTSHVLPAWLIFRPQNYRESLPEGSTIEPVRSS